MMPGSVRVHIHDDGCATVQESSGELHFDQASLVRAAYKAKECCELRKVYYPIGSEHCPCLACAVDKAHRLWRIKQGLSHVVEYTEKYAV